MKTHHSRGLAALLVLVLALTGLTARAAPSGTAMVHVAGYAPAFHHHEIRAKDLATPVLLRDEQGTILAFPPRAPAHALTVVYLHGIHGRAENGCPWLREGASEIGWLVCPAANAPLANGTFSWGGTTLEQRAVVARAEQVAHAAGADPARSNVIVGFSQGAFVALDLVRARLGRYRGLVLIGADVEPVAQELAAGGVTRLVLAAGSLDASFGRLQRSATRLLRAGVDVRFVDLGRIGHSYETTEKERLREAIAWVGHAS